MPPDLDVLLWDILNIGNEILRFTAGKSLVDYEQDRLLQLAMERCFAIVGEAMVRVRQQFPDDYRQLAAAPGVIRFRNHLVHRYDGIDNREVWVIIQSSLPTLLEEVEKNLERRQR